MSFEGYYQLLCPQGHFFTSDVYTYDYVGETVTCFICGREPIWENLVDTTNGESENYKDLEILDCTQVICYHCGGKGQVTITRYKRPEKE